MLLPDSSCYLHARAANIQLYLDQMWTREGRVVTVTLTQMVSTNFTYFRFAPGWSSCRKYELTGNIYLCGKCELDSENRDKTNNKHVHVLEKQREGFCLGFAQIAPKHP